MIMPTGRQLRELELFDSIGAPVLTLYLPVPADQDADLIATTTRLVRALGTDLSPVAQADLARELELVRDYVGSLVAAPRSLAIFSCRRRGFFRVVRLATDVVPAAWWQPQPQLQQLREFAEADRSVEVTVP